MAPKDKPFNNPFQGLALRKERRPAPKPAPPPRAAEAPLLDENEEFLRAVGAVTQVRSKGGSPPPVEPPSAAALRIETDETEALARLAELVAGDGPMDLADSDEYLEGHVPGLDARVVRKLRAGEFSWQAHVDLHGLTRGEAGKALERFVHDARIAGHRCVLVVTGRGLHSKDQIPVLRESVLGWLSRGRVARQVLAFTSARPKDGGAGAIYVLLRR